jgi:ClpP class serine protease
MVAGADEVGERIYNSKKRTIAFTPNMLASAGMWIFSNCDEVYAGEVAELGSIGVMVAYRKEDEDGEKIMLTSKRAENKNKINDDKITARINEIEDIFYSRLIRNTGLSEENLASGFNKGETISATKAKNLGFVKEITTFDKLMKSLAVMPSDNEKITKKNLKGENMEFNEENFKALVEQNKAFAANKTTIENRLNTANLNLENINAELAAKDNEIIKLKADLENKLSEQATKNESHIKEIKTRVEEAYKCNVDKDTAIAMIECKDSNEASKLAIAAMSDTENATANEGENVSNKEKELAIAIAKNMKF